MCLQTIKSIIVQIKETKTSIQCRSKSEKSGPWGIDGIVREAMHMLSSEKQRLHFQTQKTGHQDSLPKSPNTISQIFKHLNQTSRRYREIGINKMKALQSNYGYLSL